jgi:folate-binding protein YgfZ
MRNAIACADYRGLSLRHAMKTPTAPPRRSLSRRYNQQCTQFYFVEAILQGEVPVSQQLTAMLTGCGYTSLDQTGWIQVTGTDRVRWLNGMLTNSIQALGPGQGCYNFALNAQGRILGDMNVFAPPDHPDQLLIQTDRTQIAGLMAHLDHFLIMDDVELEVTERSQGLLVVGPEAASVLEQLTLHPPHEPFTMAKVSWKGGSATLIHAYSPLVARFEIWAEKAMLSPLIQELAVSASPLSAQALEDLRVLEGIPRYGVDIRNTGKAHDLPQETAPQGGQSPALHFSKGCYLGQEIVERIRSRGNVHRAFSGFELTGGLPAEGAVLQNEGKAVGELTTVASIPLDGTVLHLALGYARREMIERNLPLQYQGGTAIPIPLPYRRSERSDKRV